MLRAMAREVLLLDLVVVFRKEPSVQHQSLACPSCRGPIQRKDRFCCHCGDLLQEHQESGWSTVPSVVRPRRGVMRREMLLLLFVIVFAASTVLLSLRLTLTPTPPLLSPTPSGVPQTPDTLFYQADWSNGLSGWTGSADWKTTSGMLVSDGSYTLSDGMSPTVEPPYQVTETSNYAVEARVQQIKVTQTLGGLGCFDAVVIRGSIVSDGVKGYRLAIGCFGGATIYAAHGGSLTSIAHINFDPSNLWHIYRIEAKGATISTFIDGVQVLQVNDNTYLSGGIVGIKSQGTQIDVSNFKVIKL